jgi:hypothetical protein
MTAAEAHVWPYGDEDDDPIVVQVTRFDSASDAARTACKTFWTEYDGHEWMTNGSALTVDMRGERHKVCVSVDFEPSFYAWVESHEPIEPPTQKTGDDA